MRAVKKGKGKPEFSALLTAAACAALIVLTTAAFWGVFSNGFVWYDDGSYVLENDHVLNGPAPDSVKWAFTSFQCANWHPLTWLSHMADVKLYGLDAGKHHGTSLLLHTMNAVLLFLLLLWMTKALWPSAFAAALFAIHPLHVESVAWVAERKDVLSTFFWMLTFAAYVKYARRSQAGWYAVALAFFALGLMSKPMLVTLPFTLLLLDVWPLGRLSLEKGTNSGVLKKLVIEKAPFFAISAVSCFVTILAQRGGEAVQDFASFTLSERTANALDAYAKYVFKAFWPSSLAVFYPHGHIGLLSWPAAGALLFLAAVTTLSVITLKRAPFFAFGWFWYLGTLVPVIGLVQVGAQARADRYTYVPLMGIFIIAAWGLRSMASRWKAIRGGIICAALLLVGALSIATAKQVTYWKDCETLFNRALSVTTGNYLAHYNLGRFLESRGRKEDAAEHYEEAVRLKPDFFNALNNLGNMYAGKGRNDEAIKLFKEALEVRPNDPRTLNNMGTVLMRENRLPEAVDFLKQAVKADPLMAESRNSLGIALVRSGLPLEAEQNFRRAIDINPDYAWAHNNLGNVLADRQLYSEARKQYEEALRIKPDFEEARAGLAYLDSLK